MVLRLYVILDSLMQFLIESNRMKIKIEDSTSGCVACVLVRIVHILKEHG